MVKVLKRTPQSNLLEELFSARNRKTPLQAEE